MQSSDQRLTRFINAGHGPTLRGGLVGLEKESLRIDPAGSIAQTPHPRALGSALTHPYITTDYSEALLEFITPPADDAAQALDFMERIHRFTYSQLGDESLWAASMPCVVNGDASVRIAEYGQSNQGQFKHIYRRGLGHRYGRVMQVIAGIHFNYSPQPSFWPGWQDVLQDSQESQDFISASYFGLIRNVQRYGWLLLYLFGASPALCKSFTQGQARNLQEFDSNTFYLPYATSLRMSDIGYTNRKRCGFTVSNNSLQQYIDGLQQALQATCPPYLALGVKVDGEYRQLNANILQIENEYYSLVRPKQPPREGERVLTALRARGVSYVELRSNDLNLFEPTGLNLSQLRFLEAFLLFCLLQESPPISASEQDILEKNQLLTTRNGRQPGLCLHTADGGERSLQDWGLEICQAMQAICSVLDEGRQQPDYGHALEQQIAALQEPDCTPSARILAQMREHKEGYFHFVQHLSEQHKQHYLATPLPAAEQQRWQQWTQDSLLEQSRLEQADTESFDDYLAQFLAAV